MWSKICLCTYSNSGGVEEMRMVGAVVSLLLVFAFFLPWFDIVVTSASGADLPSLVNQLSSVTEDNTWYVYGLYLIPLFGIINAILLFLEKQSKAFSIVTSVIPLLYFALFINNLSQWGESSLFDILKIGAYITILSAIALFFISLSLPSRQKIRNVS